MTQVGYSIQGLDLESFLSCFRRCFGVTDGHENDRLHNSFNTVAVTEHLLPSVTLDPMKTGKSGRFRFPSNNHSLSIQKSKNHSLSIRKSFFQQGMRW